MRPKRGEREKALAMLVEDVARAKRHWDAKGEPYPAQLVALIRYAEERLKEARTKA